jgi:hypothetical protein
LISLRRQSLSVSRARLRPPGNIQSPSRFRLTRSTRPRFTATSFEDFAIAYDHHLSNHRSFDLGGLFHFKATGSAADRAVSVTLIGAACRRAIIDGEVVVIKDGRTNFSELQAELAAGR